MVGESKYLTVTTLDIPDGLKEQMRAIYCHLSKQLSAQEYVSSNNKELQTVAFMPWHDYAVHVANGDDPAKSSLSNGRCDHTS